MGTIFLSATITIGFPVSIGCASGGVAASFSAGSEIKDRSKAKRINAVQNEKITVLKVELSLLLDFTPIPF